ncbi:hypothetical protein BT63DRAFT_325974 [Microthyrium microscopicum]|uniref:Uncharacterized protein n=1 Tax=Microthyrium microscopicum TaxID=703497 RepID=A0A6A6U4B7_9PEZI|nr:hypothetical protein BT63DRAFT_325974 [Microthyrium microscopicum]
MISFQTPKLNIGRHSFLRSSSRDATPTENPTTPPLHDNTIFSNFPALEERSPRSSPSPAPSRLHSRRPSAASDHFVAPSIEPLRPKTADPHITRRRSKTTPIGSAPKYVMSWEDKPLPLAVDIDSKRNQNGNDLGSRRVTSPISRPNTTDNSSPRGSSSRPERSSSKGSYTLMPSINSTIHARRGSQSTIPTRDPSNASSRVQRQRSRSNSQNTTTSSLFPPASILDEVEGTLTATITELQELQGGWSRKNTNASPERGLATPTRQPQYANAPNNPSGHVRSSSRPTDSYFPAVGPSGTQSMPQTPMRAATFAADNSGQDARMRDSQQAYGDERKQAHASLMENDQVKQRLEFMSARLNEFEHEKAALIRANKEADENIQKILGRLREAKVSEQAIQNDFHAAKNDLAIMEAKYEGELKKNSTVKEQLEAEKKNSERLEAKLQDVNAQKVDVLEGNLQVRQEVCSTKKQLKQAMDELHAIKNTPPQSPAGDDLLAKFKELQHRNEILEAELKTRSPNSDLPTALAEMTFQLEDAQQRLNEKTQVISTLMATNQGSAQTASILEAQNARLQAEVSILKARTSPPSSPGRKVVEMQEALRTVRIERDQYANLLHAEIRRTTIDDHARKHPSLPFLQKNPNLEDAINIVRQRAAGYLKGNDTEPRSPTDSIDANESRGRIDELESEIEYYLHDIVLYKLDVKGYRKDLRKAKEVIRDLTQTNSNTTTPTIMIHESEPISFAAEKELR